MSLGNGVVTSQKCALQVTQECPTSLSRTLPCKSVPAGVLCVSPRRYIFGLSQVLDLGTTTSLKVLVSYL